jgi:hypothetical protein
MERMALSITCRIRIERFMRFGRSVVKLTPPTTTNQKPSVNTSPLQENWFVLDRQEIPKQGSLKGRKEEGRKISPSTSADGAFSCQFDTSTEKR